MPLKPKVLETLLLLVENYGHLVEKDEFMKKLWPGTFIGDDVLAQNISLLRKALAQGNDSQEFVVTVPKRGYRFVASVRVVTSELDQEDNGRNGSAEASQATADYAGKRARPHESNEIEHEIRSHHATVRDLPGPLSMRKSGFSIAPAKEQSSSQSTTLHFARTITLLVVISLVAGYALWKRFRAPIRPSPNSRIMLAVLPFENLTGDAGQDYISDGFTEEMITQLGRAQPERLGVIARTSAMTYKNTQKNTTQIGRELAVDYILEGSLRRVGTRVRISAQLIQVKDQTHLWAQEYDRDLGDLLTLQDEAAQAIAREIQIQLMPQHHGRLSSGRRANAKAQEAYLLGRYFWNKRTGEGFKHAIEYFRQAIAEEPDDAAAYAGLADSYLLLGGYRFVPQSESIPQARAAAQRALELDNSLGDAHASLGLIAENYDWNWAEAERQYREAIALNPNYATAHHWYGEYLGLTGRFDEGLAEIQVAERLDPLSVIISNDHAVILLRARQYDKAVAQFRKTLEMDSNFYPAWRGVVEAELYKGTTAPQSLAALERLQAPPDPLERDGILAYAYARTGRRAEAKKILQHLKNLAKQGHVDNEVMAIVYLGLGDKEQALSFMEKEYAEHSTGLTGIKVHPIYDPLRSDPRFADLMRRVGLTQ